MSTVSRKDFRYFARRLEALRDAADVTQGTLAAITGVSQPTVQAWLAGTSGPNIADLMTLADYFHLPTVDELIRPVPHGGQSCVVRKALLRQMRKRAMDTSAKLEQILQESGKLQARRRKKPKAKAKKAKRKKS